jgi:hypothetical protein
MSSPTLAENIERIGWDGLTDRERGRPEPPRPHQYVGRVSPPDSMRLSVAEIHASRIGWDGLTDKERGAPEPPRGTKSPPSSALATGLTAARSAASALQRKIEALPTTVRESPTGKGLETAVADLTSQFMTLQGQIHLQIETLQKSGRWNLLWGGLIGLPVGLVCSYLAYKIGWA